MAAKISESVTVHFWDESKKSFRSWDRLGQWINQEIEFSEKIAAANSSSIFQHPKLDNQVISLRNARQSLVNAKANKDADLAKETQREIDSLLSDLKYCGRTTPPLFLASDTTDARRYLELVETDVNAAEISLSRSLGLTPNLKDASRWVDAFDAYISLREDDFDSKVVLSRQSANIAQLMGAWEEKFSKLEESVLKSESEQQNAAKRLKSLAVRQIRNHKRLRFAHENAMQKQRQEFSTEMTLKASEKFWSKKRRLNRLRSGAAFSRLCWTGGIGGILLVGVFFFIYNSLPIDSNFGVGQTLVFAIPTLAYVWLLRIFANEYKSNQKMADDAEEREAMIFTFKALEHEERVGAEERLIILNSLFRPHDSSSEESIPLPAWESLVGRIQGKH